ncbi:MAG TPA: hypothetical protein VD930_04350 [Gemmatimonadales bacterium]|nr:hypothetical protein [Gemmatimonadales bacterium]
MVNTPNAARSGAARFGCLLSLAVFAVALYYGVNIGQIYFRYYQLMDGMRTQARLAPTLQDDVIQRRLVAQADSLLPGKRPQFRITRGGTPNRIVIETVYTEGVDLPLFKRTFVMHPRAEQPL